MTDILAGLSTVASFGAWIMHSYIVHNAMLCINQFDITRDYTLKSESLALVEPQVCSRGQCRQARHVSSFRAGIEPFLGDGLGARR